jgi:hypothetical protein
MQIENLGHECLILSRIYIVAFNSSSAQRPVSTPESAASMALFHPGTVLQLVCLPAPDRVRCKVSS